MTHITFMIAFAAPSTAPKEPLLENLYVSVVTILK